MTQQAKARASRDGIRIGPYSVRPMTEMDIPQVMEIDREAFSSRWPPPSNLYKRELKNRLASYIVVTENGSSWTMPRGSSAGSLFDPLVQLFRRRPSRRGLLPFTDFIAGFAGFWLMADEAHLTTIAVRVRRRKKGIGELLLISIIDQALERSSRVVTLEVRVSNYDAQALYRKYGFREVGLRKGYYAEDGEDALIMTTDPLTSPAFRERFLYLKAQHLQRLGQAQ
jgi:ribosomal-protein-alanine N-acetyltransferase